MPMDRCLHTYLCCCGLTRYVCMYVPSAVYTVYTNPLALCTCIGYMQCIRHLCSAVIGCFIRGPWCRVYWLELYFVLGIPTGTLPLHWMDTSCVPGLGISPWHCDIHVAMEMVAPIQTMGIPLYLPPLLLMSWEKGTRHYIVSSEHIRRGEKGREGGSE